MAHPRSQPYRVTWPLTPDSAQSIDEMFQILFDDIRNGAIDLNVNTAGVLAAIRGGTGFSSYTIGDILYANTATTLAKLADASTGNALLAGGVGLPPSYGQVNLTTTVTGVLPIANGGTNDNTFSGDAAFQGLVYFDGTKLSSLKTSLALIGGQAQLRIGRVSNASILALTASTTNPENIGLDAADNLLMLLGEGGTVYIGTKAGGNTTNSFIVQAGGNNALAIKANLINAPQGIVTLGVNTSVAGKLSLYGGTSGLVDIQVAAAAGTWSLTLPTGGGTNRYPLLTNGSGVTSWSQLAAADLSNGTTGTGAIVLADSPALTTSPTAPTQSSSDNSTKIATTSFVTTAVANAVAAVNPAVAVEAATTTILQDSPVYNNGVGGIGATITSGSFNTTLVVDGYTPALNDRILVKNENGGGGLGAAKNGVYLVTQLGAIGFKWVLTRALDYNQPSDINDTGAIPVINGTVNAQTQWVLTSHVTTVGTDALTFTQFTLNPSSIFNTAGTGLTGTGTNTVSLVVPVPVANGGTGAATLTNHGVLIGQATSAVAPTSAGTAGFVLKSGGASADPSFVEKHSLESSITITTTGNIDNLSITTSGLQADLLIMNNATLSTIRGIAAGTAGQRLTIISIGAGQVDLAHQNTNSSTTNRLVNFATSASTSLAAGVGTATYIYDDASSRWRLIAHNQGAWITSAYASGNYTGNSSMTWTVEAGDVATQSYFLNGQILTVETVLINTTVGGTPAGQLRVGGAAWGGFTAAVNSQAFSQNLDNGTNVAGWQQISVVTGNFIIFQRDSVGTNWAASTNLTRVGGTIIFEVT